VRPLPAQVAARVVHGLLYSAAKVGCKALMMLRTLHALGMATRCSLAGSVSRHTDLIVPWRDVSYVIPRASPPPEILHATASGR
jgi:hypothetical protein